MLNSQARRKVVQPMDSITLTCLLVNVWGIPFTSINTMCSLTFTKVEIVKLQFKKDNKNFSLSVNSYPIFMLKINMK